jgi:hypothetical protein
MKRVLVLLFSVTMLGMVLLLASNAGAAEFTQCPPVYKDTGCQFLVTVSSSGVSVAQDSAQEPYEGAEDALIGVVNNTSGPLSSVPLEAEGLFSFDGDGLCDPGEMPLPSGCKPLSKQPNGEAVPSGTTCAGQDGYCGFEPPPGEPTGVTFEGLTIAGFASNGDAVTGYEGPGVWFSGIACNDSSGVINFSPALEPGKSAYFSLEEPPQGQSLGTSNSSSVTTSLSASTVVQGAPVTDSATVTGCTAASAGGTMSYAVYSNPTCTSLVTQAGEAPVSNGVAGASAAETGLAPGTYYWQASYNGELRNAASKSECGAEVLKVLAPTTTTTVQSGAGVTGASLTVPAGTAVTDQAHIAGALAASATGSVVYRVYKNSTCTLEASPASTATVNAGAVGASSAVDLGVGTYYWKAEYSGDGVTNAGSVSACGSEILVVARKANLGGLPSTHKCFSKRRFLVHPTAPRGVKLVSAEVQIDGAKEKAGRLVHGGIAVSLVGLPKGTFRISLIAKSSKGVLYEEVRTFHTCVVSKRHRRK